MPLRPALPSDSHSLASIHVQAWRETYAGIVPDSFLSALSVPKRELGWGEQLSQPRGGRFDFVAEEEGRAVGFCGGGPLRSDWGANAPFAAAFPEALKRYQGEFYAAYLLKSHQGRGIGRAMFQAVRDELRRRGSGSMLVWVLKGNPALGFYEKMGGRRVGESAIMIGRELEQVALAWDPL